MGSRVRAGGGAGYNSNLAAWLRLRSAAHSFGLSFRGRIEFFLSVLLVRTAMGVGWLLVVRRQQRHHQQSG